jgi:hypothetical protein
MPRLDKVEIEATIHTTVFISSEQLGQAIFEEVTNRTGVDDDAGCDWYTDSRGNTFIGQDCGWFVSNEPDVASMVDTANIFYNGQVMKSEMTPITTEELVKLFQDAIKKAGSPDTININYFPTENGIEGSWWASDKDNPRSLCTYRWQDWYTDVPFEFSALIGGDAGPLKGIAPHVISLSDPEKYFMTSEDWQKWYHNWKEKS